MIELQDITWRVDAPHASAESRGLTILDNVSMTLPEASTMAVVGPSGSGKTSLMMMIGGLEQPSAGSIVINGQTITALSEDARADFRRHHIGIVFQAFHLAPAMSALENVMLPLLLSHAPNAEKVATQRLDQVGLGHRLRHFPSQLSGGEKQRCALARATVMSPAVVLADEPTGNLDDENSTLITDLLFSLAREEGSSVLLVTHDASLAANCDAIVTMRDGRLTQHAEAASAGPSTPTAPTASMPTSMSAPMPVPGDGAASHLEGRIQ